MFSRAKPQRRKENPRNEAALWVFAPLREIFFTKNKLPAWVPDAINRDRFVHVAYKQYLN
jgi:hypothetical protein